MNKFVDDKGQWISADPFVKHAAKATATPDISNIWQAIVVYNRIVKVGFHKESIPFTFYSRKVCGSKDAAAHYIPYFIKDLIKDGSLPNDVINADSSVNQNLIKTMVQKLDYIVIEKDTSNA